MFCRLIKLKTACLLTDTNKPLLSKDNQLIIYIFFIFMLIIRGCKIPQ